MPTVVIFRIQLPDLCNTRHKYRNGLHAIPLFLTNEWNLALMASTRWKTIQNEIVATTHH